MARKPLHTGLPHTVANARIATTAFAICQDVRSTLNDSLEKLIKEGVDVHPHAIGLGVSLAFMSYVQQLTEMYEERRKDNTDVVNQNTENYINAIYSGFISGYTLNNPNIQKAIEDGRLLSMPPQGSA